MRPSELADRLRAERRAAPFLLHLDGEGHQRIVELDAVDRLSIGRHAASDVALTWDSEVSGLHAVYRSFQPAEPAATTATTSYLTPPELTAAQLRVLRALCDDRYGAPPSNRELADELFLSVDTVKSHLRELFRAFAVPDLPQNRKRAELVRRAHELGLVRRR